MGVSVSPSQSSVQSVLRSFLLAIFPGGNAEFFGWIAGNVLTVTKITLGVINVGDNLLGTEVVAGTTISEWGSGTSGGIGTYIISNSMTVGDATSGATLSTGVEVFEGQDNRVPEPISSDFVVFTLMRQERLETNVDLSVDAKFVGNIVNNLMTITEVDLGEIEVGSNVFGVGVVNPTVVTQFVSGSGGVGTYTVQPLQNTPQNSQVLAAGVLNATQQTKLTFQLDVHGPNSYSFATIISTLFRDNFSFDFFQQLNVAVSPLYADDPHQAPFDNAEQQYETRWIVEAAIQVASTVAIPQQFFDTIQIGVVDVDVAYPAS